MRQKHNHKQIELPEVLTVIPDAPKSLYAIGDTLESLLKMPRVAIVGSRKMTAYGRQVTEKIAGELVNNGVVIVSGLAYGVDACAHNATLAAGGKAIAVLGCGLDKIYPSAHEGLARQIIDSGGVILSEYPPGTTPYKTNFLARNRIISGLSNAIFITEAAQRSGSLNTASHALNQGIPVLAIPGNITSPLSAGTNNLIKSGAYAVTDTSDILAVLGIEADQRDQNVPLAKNEEEYIVLKLMTQGISDASDLLRRSHLSASIFNQTLTMLEIDGKVKPQGNNHWTIA